MKRLMLMALVGASLSQPVLARSAERYLAGTSVDLQRFISAPPQEGSPPEERDRAFFRNDRAAVDSPRWLMASGR